MIIPAVDEAFIDADGEYEIASTDFYLDENKINGRASGLLEIKQAIYFILNSERYDYVIYSWNYGFETKDLFGMDIDYVKAEIELRIKEALIQDERITDVGAFDFEKNKTNLHVTFTVSTVAGDIESEVNLDV